MKENGEAEERKRKQFQMMQTVYNTMSLFH
jgi:hypothetical protein